MITTFHQKRIRGVLGVLPENEYDYDEETKPFQDIHTKRLKRIMGYGKRRAAKSKTTTSDLCVYGFDYVLKHNWIKKEEIGAVVVTISPTIMYHMSVTSFMESLICLTMLCV